MIKSVTKSSLIYQMMEEYYTTEDESLLPAAIDESVRLLFDTMSLALARGDRIEIRGFGSFSLNYRPPRVGRNPKTGECVEVPEKFVPHFKPGKELRRVVDENADKYPLDFVVGEELLRD